MNQQIKKLHIILNKLLKDSISSDGFPKPPSFEVLDESIHVLLKSEKFIKDIPLCEHKSKVWINNDWKFFCTECGISELD